MSRILCAALSIGFAAAGHTQTAEELVQKNLLAHGGIDKIKSVKSLHMTGRLQSGSFTVQVGRDALAPNMVRETFTIQ